MDMRTKGLAAAEAPQTTMLTTSFCFVSAMGSDVTPVRLSILFAIRIGTGHLVYGMLLHVLMTP